MSTNISPSLHALPDPQLLTQRLAKESPGILISADPEPPLTRSESRTNLEVHRLQDLFKMVASDGDFFVVRRFENLMLESPLFAWEISALEQQLDELDNILSRREAALMFQ